jgi:hypothetical protein
MSGGAAGMTANVAGTNGGGSGTSGMRRRLAFVMAGLFLAVLALIAIGNAESMISDFAAAGVHETVAHIWIWQVTSILAWICVTPLIWWGVARIRLPRFGWPAIIAASLIGLPIASGLHIGLMILFRKLAYLFEGAAYHFEGEIASPFLYEFRKDIPTYLQFVVLAGLCHWLLCRAGITHPPVTPAQERYVAVGDGAVTHQVPVSEIVQINAAGNYVEIDAGGRSLLHRATLAAMEAELGALFVRIHRGRLVNRDAIRRVETNQSGDFELVLADGRTVKGSRRYRADLEQRL